MRKFLLFTCLCLTIAWGDILAQQRTVTGKVTSKDDGTPLPGVNVVIKGSTAGTVTDANGGYTIAVADADILQFSFIGLTTQETTVGTRTSIDVAMAQDVTQLGEIIVTAAGIERQERSLG